MRLRRGFTLVELMVAIVLTGIVSLIAYGSIQAAIDSSERLATQRHTVESEAMVRTLISDALRHPADSPDGDPAFALVSVAGNRGNGIQFVSRGVSGSLGAGRLWRVALTPTGQGLELDAISLEGSPAAIRGELPNIFSIDVRVLRAVDDREWQNYWESTQQFPSAVEISFRDSLGRSGAPLVVQTGFGSK
jgi:prepilin-type N-terminal cleavage/methylation domain-containing protein